MYKYHVQYQALEYANAILPVPADYPLKQGISMNFRDDFKELTKFAKTMYQDVAASPEKYGMFLADVNEYNGVGSLMGHGLIHRKSWDSLHRLVDVLYALFYSGNMNDETLQVDAKMFASKIKEMKLTGYSAILDGLADIGFVFTGYAQGKIKEDHVMVSFPANPKIISTLKTYCECRDLGSKHTNASFDETSNKDHIKGNLDFYAFDYKHTADLSVLPEINWVNDKVFTWPAEAKEFYTAFYQYMTKNPKTEYQSTESHCDFFISGQMAAKLRYEDDHLRCDIGCFTNPEYEEILTKSKNGIKRTFFALILYLRIKDDNNKDRFDNLPAHILEHMKNHKCQDCNAFERHKQKSGGRCPYTVIWMHDGVENRNCAFSCFHFENPKIEDIPAYCELLFAEYERPGFKNINRCHVRA